MSDSTPLNLFQRARDIGPESEESSESQAEHHAAPEAQGRRVGDYELLEEIGRGGFGRVYRARDALGREVALKVLLEQDPSTVERFRREAKATAALDHPNVLRIHSAELAAGQLFIVTELVPDCRTLDQALSNLGREAGLNLILAAARGLAHAHERGLTHRDVKPANLLVGKEGRVRVADFGLVLATADGRLTQTGHAVGTPRYMAPEQRAARRDIGPPCDVWGLGVILYRFLCGVFPYESHATGGPLLPDASPPVPPRTHDATISRGLERICLRALAPDPRQRYPDAGAMARDLTRALVPPLRAPKALAAAVLVGLVLVAWLSWNLDPGLPSPTPNPTASRPDLGPVAPGLPDPLGPPLVAEAPLPPGPPLRLIAPVCSLSTNDLSSRLEIQLTEVIEWGGAGEAFEQLKKPTTRDGRPRGDHLLHRGRLCLELGRYSEARGDFGAFIRRSPRDDSYRGLGLVMTCLAWALAGDRTQTLGTGTEAIEAIRGVHPSFRRIPEFYAQIVLAYLLVDAPLQAQRVVTEAREVFPKSSLLHAAQGSIYVTRGRLEEAWVAYAEGIKRAGDDLVGSLLRAGAARLEVGARAEAALDLEAALRAATSDHARWLTLLLRCRLRLESGQLDAAEVDLLALAPGPPSWRVSALRAQLALARGSTRAAGRELDLAERLSPGRSSLMLARGRLAWQEGRYEDVVPLVDRVLGQGARPAARGRALALRAFALARLSRSSEARRDARRALECVPSPEGELRGRLEVLLGTKK